MLLTISKAEQDFLPNGSECRKITGTLPDGREVTKKVLDKFKAQWPLLQQGKQVELTMKKEGQWWNIMEVKEVQTISPDEPPISAFEDPPPTPAPPMRDASEPVIPPAQKQGVRMTLTDATIGMVCNRIGSHIDNNTLEFVFKVDEIPAILTEYRRIIFACYGLTFDPTFPKSTSGV